MKIGYARVSTDAQETALQMDALKRAKCNRIYEEMKSTGPSYWRTGLSVCAWCPGGFWALLNKTTLTGKWRCRCRSAKSMVVEIQSLSVECRFI